MEVIYTVPLTGKAGGEIARNGYYRIAANITGLVGQDCQVAVTVAEWESPVTQSVDLAHNQTYLLTTARTFRGGGRLS